MAKNVKKQFVIDLTLNTKDAEKQLQATARSMKDVLANMGKASDKMGYFKELVDYIKQIDTAMTALKNKDPMKFNELFDGLDGNLKQTFESLFGIASKDMSVLDDLRNKLKNLDTGKVGVAELRNMAQEINNLFESLGQVPPLDIDKYFKDKGNSVERIKMLTDQLDSFATMWSEVNQKVQQGFGGSGSGIGGSGSGISDNLGDTSAKIQQQIDTIKKQIETYKALKEQFIDLAYAKEEMDLEAELPDDFKADYTVESIQQLIDVYQKAAKAKKEFENAGDTTSVDYYANLEQMSKVALQLNDIDNALTEDLEDDMNAIKRGRGTLLGVYEKIIEEANRFLDRELEEVVNRTPDRIDAIINSKNIELESLSNRLTVAAKKSGSGSGTGSGGGGNGTGTGNGSESGPGGGGPIDVDFTSLENTIRTEMASINAKLDNALKVELVKDDTKDIQSIVENIKINIDNIASLVESYQNSKVNATNQTEVDNMKNNLAQLLKVVSEFNERKTADGNYQRQEIGAAILSDGSISAGYGERGSVPWDRMANSLLGNLTKTLLVDVHSHPWAQFYNGKKFANDPFSGSKGDLGAFRFSKELGAQMAAMITGNIMRTLDLSKLTDSQMRRFRSALSDIEKKHANTPEYSKYMEYDSQTDSLYYKKQANIEEQHKVSEAFESLMYKAFERIGFSKDQVEQEIFKKYNLTDDAQLTALAERLVQLSHASQNALSPVERLSQIVSRFGGDVYTDQAQAALKAYEKGERSAADVFNLLNTKGYTVNQDTIDSLMRIDTAGDMPVVESLLTKISSVLDTINANIVSIEGNTRLTTDNQIDHTIDDLTNLKNGFDPSKFFTSNIKSIFDSSNISEFKNDEVLSLANEAVDDFTRSFNELIANSIDGVDPSELQRVLDNFKLAISYLQDASQQIDLYQNRTRKMVMDGSDPAEDTLFARRTEVVNKDTIDTLLAYLRQTKSTSSVDSNASDNGVIAAISHLDKHIQALTQVAQTQQIDSIIQGQGSFVETSDTSENFARNLYDLAEIAYQGLNDVINDISKKFADSGVIDVKDVDRLFESYQNAVARVYDAREQIHISDMSNNTRLIDEKTGESLLFQALSMMQSLDGSNNWDGSDDTVFNEILTLIQQAKQSLVDNSNKNHQVTDGDNYTSQLVSALVTLTSAIEMLTLQLQADNGSMPIQNTQSYPTTNISIGGTDFTSEISQCEALLDIIDKIRWAVEWKTDAFENEKNTVQTVIPLEIDALKELEQYLDVLRMSIESLFNNISVNSGVFTSWKDDLIAVENHVQNIIGLLQQIDAVSGTPIVQVSQITNGDVAQPERGYALESTLQTTNSILGQILTAIGNNESITKLINPLNNAVLKLEKVANGIVEHQKTQRTNLTPASTRIANNYGQLSSISGTAVAGIGDDFKVKQMKALADGVVRVEGAVKDADGVWKGFVVDINESNEAVVRAINEQSEFAQSLNQSAAAVKKTKKDVDALKQLQQAGIFKAAKDTISEDFKTLDFKATDFDLTQEQKDLVRAREDAILQLEEYKIKVAEGAKFEQSAIDAITEKLHKQIEAYKQKYNIENAGGKGNKKAPGANVITTATAKYNALNNTVNNDFANSKILRDQMSKYTVAYQNLIDMQSKFKVGAQLTDDQALAFKEAQIECNKLAQGINKIITDSQKLSAKGIGTDALLGDDFVDDFEGRKKALREFVEVIPDAEIGEFNKDFTQLNYTVDNGDGTFTQMTASLNAARSAIVATAGDVKEAKTAFGSFVDEIKGKFKTILTYLVASMGWQEVFQQVRRGIEYVREIDSALTELKKVTNETNETYDAFLQTASKTAGALGSTVSDFVNATADFARLGYGVDEASKLAEAASVYKNVGDGINDVAQASESIISTMKAFGIEAKDAMSIVDRFNEVGKLYCLGYIVIYNQVVA